MTLSYAQIDAGTTEAEAEAEIIQRLSELGFASKGWQSGSVQLTIGVKIPAWIYSKWSVFAQTILRGMHNETATGEFLTRFSKSQYDNTRKPAIAAQYTVRHTTASGEGPHSVAIGDLIATDGISVYRNIEGGTLTSAATVDLVYECEIPGSDGNTNDGAIVTLTTPLAGVTITNPAPSQVIAGADEEQDPELVVRNTTRWGTLSINQTGDGWRNVALSVTGVGRSAVDDTNPRGPYTLDLYIAGATSAAGSGLAAAVQALVDERKSPTDDIVTLDAPSTAVVVSGNYYYQTGKTGVPAAVQSAIEAYVNASPIGGYQLTSSLKGIDRAGITGAIRSVSGVTNVDLTAPTSDIILPSFNIAAVNTAALVGNPI